MVNHDAQIDSGTSDSLSNRYGSGGKVRSHQTSFTRRGWIIATFLLVVAIGATAWISFTATSRHLVHKDVGFTFDDLRHTTVEFQVAKDADAEVTCAIQALAENYSVVGWDTMDFPATADEGITEEYYKIQLRTDAEAVSGGVHSCWFSEDQPKTDRFTSASVMVK